MPKTHPRVAAYGDVDELNSCLGAALAALPEKASGLRPALERLQEELFIVGALLAAPPEKAGRLGPPFDQGLPPNAAARLEREIDGLSESLKPMTRFIMPGGSPTGACLHLARAVCRRAERSAVALAAGEKVADGILVYLNRLSDYLFTAARWANAALGAPETEWRGLAKKP